LGYAETCEFQKEDGPQPHRVFCMYTEATSINIGIMIWAHIPEEPSFNYNSNWLILSVGFDTLYQNIKFIAVVIIVKIIWVGV